MLAVESVIPQLALSLMPWLCHMLVVGAWSDSDVGATQGKCQPEDFPRGLFFSALQWSCFLPSVLQGIWRFVMNYGEQVWVHVHFPILRVLYVFTYFNTPTFQLQAICILTYFTRKILSILYHLTLLMFDLINIYAFAGLSQMTFSLTCLLFLKFWVEEKSITFKLLLCLNNICKENTKCNFYLTKAGNQESEL